MAKQQNEVLTKFIILVLLLALLNIYVYGAYLVLIAGVLLILRDGKIAVNGSLLLLIGFSLFYIIFSLLGDRQAITTVFKIIIFPLAYMSGFVLFSDKTSEKLKNAVIIGAVFMASHAAINLVYNFSLGGFAAFSGGISYDVFDKTVSAATGQAINYYAVLALFGFAIFSSDKKYLKIILAVFSLIAVVHAVLIGNRLMLLLLFLSVFFATLGLFFLLDQKTKIIKAAIIVMAILLGVYILFENNVFGIKEIYESSYMYHRLNSNNAIGFFETSRFEAKAYYITHILDYPFGGGHIRLASGTYAHELWLDVFDDAGIIPFVLLWAYTITSFFRCFRFVRSSEDKNKGLLIWCFYTVMLVAFFFEPIVQGGPLAFALYCFVDGMVSRSLCRRKNMV